MIPKVNNSVTNMIISLLENKVFEKLNKSRKDFIVSVLWHILSIKGRINFLQPGRFSPLCEQTYRNQFEKQFDFFTFNKQLINQVSSGETIIAFDPSYIPKAGKSTYGRGRYWSGVAGAAKWGLDICGFAVVDIVNNTALHLKAWQTPSADQLAKKGLNLLSHYASLVTQNAEQYKAFSTYLVADAYFSKRPFVKAVQSSGFTGLLDFNDFNPNQFSLDLSNEEIKIYSGIVDSKAFKMDIKLAIAIFYKEAKETARKLFFSTDLKQSGEKIVRYYQARFQIEFLYRDAKQFTGLTNCQGRSKNKLDFHFNATLTAERFMCMFAINPNTPKNQKIVKELLNYGKIAA